MFNNNNNKIKKKHSIVVSLKTKQKRLDLI